MHGVCSSQKKMGTLVQSGRRMEEREKREGREGDGTLQPCMHGWVCKPLCAITDPKMADVKREEYVPLRRICAGSRIKQMKGEKSVWRRKAKIGIPPRVLSAIWRQLIVALALNPPTPSPRHKTQSVSKNSACGGRARWNSAVYSEKERGGCR